MSKEYVDKAESDAWDCLENFLDEVIEQIVADGEASDDLHNDYSGGDEYHHENHVDQEYDLKEAATLLDELSDYEEDDDGLWQGLEPRRAISAQAAYTYGNAVLSYWRDLVSDLNDDVGAIDLEDHHDPEKFWGAWVRAWVLLHPLESEAFGHMVQAAWTDLLAGNLGTLLILADKIEEGDDASAHVTLSQNLRKYGSANTFKDDEDDDEPDDDGEPEGDDRDDRQDH